MVIGKNEEIIKKNLPSNFNYDIRFIKNFVVNEAVNESLKAYLHKNFPSILCEIENVDCEDNDKKVVISVNEKIMDYVSAKKVKEQTEKFLQSSFYVHIDVYFEIQKEKLQEAQEEVLVFDDFDIIPEDRYISVSDVEPIVGDLTETNAYYIKDKTQPEENVVLCGKMLFLKDYTYTPKKRVKEEEEKEEAKQKECS